MLDFKKVLLFVVLFGFIFAALNFIVPALELDKWYNKQFIKVGNTVYGDYRDKAQVKFVKFKSQTNPLFKHPFKDYDDGLMVQILSKAQIEEATRRAKLAKATEIKVNHAQFYIDTWQFGWIPLMLVMSLILATPIPLRRRLIALILGIMLMLGFTFFRFWVRFVVDINRHGWLQLGEQGPFMKKAFVYMNTGLMFMGASLMAAVLIWAIVAFRKGDQVRFLKPVEEA